MKLWRARANVIWEQAAPGGTSKTRAKHDEGLASYIIHRAWDLTVLIYLRSRQGSTCMDTAHALVLLNHHRWHTYRRRDDVGWAQRCEWMAQAYKVKQNSGYCPCMNMTAVGVAWWKKKRYNRLGDNIYRSAHYSISQLMVSDFVREVIVILRLLFIHHVQCYWLLLHSGIVRIHDMRACIYVRMIQ
jgi:hypothetical protein